MPVLYEIFEEIEELEAEDRFLLEAEIKKRNAELRRKILSNEILKSREEYVMGKYKSFSSAESLFQDLDN